MIDEELLPLIEEAFRLELFRAPAEHERDPWLLRARALSHHVARWTDRQIVEQLREQLRPETHPGDPLSDDDPSAARRLTFRRD